MRNSEGEKEYWREQEAKILILMLVPISLSGVFYDEHARRTDQMILCCSFGKITLYGIKIAAGISFAALAVSTGLLITAMMVYVPEQYRLAAQVWDWLPWGFLTPWNVFGQYTVSILGLYFAPWQAVPVIYLIVSVGIVLAGRGWYQRYQICGR